MKRVKSILLVTLILSTKSFSSDSLVDILQEAGDIATETKLNIKDMPSAITVLREEDFEKVGAKNLYEALSLISGIELSMLSNGWLYPIIRGQRSAFLSGYDKIKFFIDGVAVNDTTRGTSHFYLDFPIELIERIEVFRGANSALYGSGAYSGAIHIITKTKTSKDNSIFLSTGTGNKNKGGANYSFEENGLSLKFDIYYQKENNSNPATPVTLDSDKGKFEINRGHSDERLRDYSIGLYAQKDNFSLYTRLKSQKSGNYYGIYEILEEKEHDQDKKSFVSEVAYKDSFKIGDFTLKGGVNIFDNEAMFEVVPKEFGYYYGNLYEIPENGLVSGNSYQDRTLYLDASFKFKKFYSNDLKIGIKKEYTKSIQNEYFYNENFQSTILTDYYIKPDSKINKLSLYLQNIYGVSENFDISIFGRVDNYKRYKSQYSLQIGGIYRFNDEFKLKAVYNRAYRLPSWSEQLTSSLNSEKLEGIEASFIYENILKTSSLQINLFSYTLTDTIDAYSIPTVADNAKLRTLKPKRDIDINEIMARVRGVNKAFILKEKVDDTNSEVVTEGSVTAPETTQVVETQNELTTESSENTQSTEVVETTVVEEVVTDTKPSGEIAEIKPNEVVVIKPNISETDSEVKPDTSTETPIEVVDGGVSEVKPDTSPETPIEVVDGGVSEVKPDTSTETPVEVVDGGVSEVKPDTSTETPVEVVDGGVSEVKPDTSTETPVEVVDGGVSEVKPDTSTETPVEVVDGSSEVKPDTSTETPVEVVDGSSEVKPDTSTETVAEVVDGSSEVKPDTTTETPVEVVDGSSEVKPESVTNGESVTNKPTVTANADTMPPTTTTAISQETEILPSTQNTTTVTTTVVDNSSSEEKEEEAPQEVSSVEYYFKNINEIKSRGIEVEYSLSLNRKNQIHLSYSFVELENSQTATYLPATDQTLIKGVYTFAPMPNLRFHTFVNYRSEIDKDLHSNEIDSFVSIDETIVWQKDANSYYTLSIKNLLDEDIRYNSITGLQPDGLKADGRSVFFSYRYQF